MTKIIEMKHEGAQRQIPQAKINVHVFGDVWKARQPQSTQVLDPFEELYGDAEGILRPPFNPETLAQMPIISDTLGQCIEAYVTNCESFGYTLNLAAHVQQEEMESDDEPPEVKAERARLRMLFDYCNPTETFTRVRRQVRRDRETIGYGCMEVLRNNKAETAEFYRLPSWSVRMIRRDNEPTKIVQMVRNIEGDYVPQVKYPRFRRFVQYYGYGQKRYFKEFGDPRPISMETGKVDASAPQATEVILFNNDVTYGPYGLPRWIGNLYGVLGSRKAEEVNLLFFDHKGIPPMIIMVSGGTLTQAAADRIQNVFRTEIKGSDNFHDIVILEAEPFEGGDIGGEKLATVKIEAVPLTAHIEKDATHQEYREKNSEAVRSSMRLAPIYIGRSQEYTRATALESIKVTENQVFIPERQEFDEVINRHILSSLQINTLTFETKGVNISNESDLVRAIGQVKDAVPMGLIADKVADILGEDRIPMDKDAYKIPVALIGAARKYIIGDEAEEDQQQVPPGQQPEGQQPPPGDNRQPNEEETEKFIEKMFQWRDALHDAEENGAKIIYINKPMPTPKKGETQSEFVSRFMSSEAMQSEFPDKDQRLRVAYSQWRRHKKKGKSK